MMIQRWLLGLVIGATLASTGCLSCCHHAATDLSLAPEHLANMPCGTQRHRVQVIIINGLDPLHLANIEALRDRLNACGFAKVSVGEWYHTGLFEKEIAKIRCEDPDVRLVVVGYSVGAGAARNLCNRVLASGGTVDSLIELAPVTVPLVGTSPYEPFTGRRIVVSSDWTIDRYTSPNATLIPVKTITPYMLPTHESSIGIVLQEVQMAAGNVAQVEELRGPTLPLVDNPAPLPGTIWPDQPASETVPLAPVPNLAEQPNFTSQPRPNVIPPATTRTPPGTLTSESSR